MLICIYYRVDLICAVVADKLGKADLVVDYKECLRFSSILLRLYASLDHEDWPTALFLSSRRGCCQDEGTFQACNKSILITGSDFDVGKS